MSSTRRQDVFTKNINPLVKIYQPANPDNQSPPHYIPRSNRRQIYDYMSRVNVNMRFGMYSINYHTLI